MEFKLHDKVVVKRDLPEWGLHEGDEGVVVDYKNSRGSHILFCSSHPTFLSI